MLGDVGKPTYAVTVSDQEAARFREEFAAKKEAKRLVPSESSAPPEDEHPKGRSPSDASTISKPMDTPHRSTAGTSERGAVDTLHQRNVGVDPARDDWDSYRESLSNNGTARTNRHESAESTGLESELSEVRGMLRRESTRGRRRPAPPPKPSVEVINESGVQPAVSGQSSPSLAGTHPAGATLAQSNISIHDQAYQPAAREPLTLRSPPVGQPPRTPQSAEQSPAPPAYQQPGGRMSPIPQAAFSHPASSIVAGARLRSDSLTSRPRTDSIGSANARVASPAGRTGNAFAAGSPLQPLNLVQQQQMQMQQQHQGHAQVQGQGQGQVQPGAFRAGNGNGNGAGNGAARPFGPN